MISVISHFPVAICGGLRMFGFVLPLFPAAAPTQTSRRPQNLISAIAISVVRRCLLKSAEVPPLLSREPSMDVSVRIRVSKEPSVKHRAQRRAFHQSLSPIRSSPSRFEYSLEPSIKHRVKYGAFRQSLSPVSTQTRVLTEGSTLDSNLDGRLRIGFKY